MINPIRWWLTFITKLNNKSFEWGFNNRDKILSIIENTLIISNMTFDFVSSVLITLCIVLVPKSTNSILIIVILELILLHIFIVLANNIIEKIKHFNK